MSRLSRRALLAGLGATGAAALAGCSSGGDDPPGDVQVGPGGSLTFDPETYTVSVGETVTWNFASGGHNVSCRPDHSDSAALPEGAEPFASYEGDDRTKLEPVRSQFEHTFETPGEYTYVCIPHVGADMIGTVVVEE